MKILALLLAFAFSSLAHGAGPWELAVIFLGGEEKPAYQHDIDRNVLELARLQPGPALSISIARELPGRGVEYHTGRGAPAGGTLHDWSPLFFRTPQTGVQIPGVLRVNEGIAPGSILEPEALRAFFGRAFKNPAASRALVIYGHGFGFGGVAGISLKDLRERLEASLPRRGPRAPLDLLWLDSCFMGSIEAAYELRRLTPIYLGSEDAEFSAGVPYDAFSLLASGNDAPSTLARTLAERFLEFYSYSLKGSQHAAIRNSSATVSVIETRRLEPLVKELGELARAVGRLEENERLRLRARLARARMQSKDLVDLGQFLLVMKQTRPALAPLVDRVLARLELARPEDFVSAPRILLRSPQPGALLVYGFNDWLNGFQGDRETKGRIPHDLKPAGYVSAPADGRWPAPVQHAWPSRPVRQFAWLAPFSVGLNEFDAFFADPATRRPLTAPVSYVRVSDLAFFATRTSTNPIVFRGYTQGVGRRAERYTGLNVLDVTYGTDRMLDYLDTEFARVTNWSNL